MWKKSAIKKMSEVVGSSGIYRKKIMPSPCFYIKGFSIAPINRVGRDCTLRVGMDIAK